MTATLEGRRLVKACEIAGFTVTAIGFSTDVSSGSDPTSVDEVTLISAVVAAAANGEDDAADPSASSRLFSPFEICTILLMAITLLIAIRTLGTIGRETCAWIGGNLLEVNIKHSSNQAGKQRRTQARAFLIEYYQLCRYTDGQ